MDQLQDNFGRSFRYLRLSITDNCNFRCQYCLPNGYQPKGKPNFLKLDEIRRVLTAFSHVGTSKIRITGGEPTMRKDFEDVIGLAANTPGIRCVATTTNGYRLAKNAKRWREAGLSRVNISMDSLDPDGFKRITGTDRYHDVMDGINTALAEGYSQVKLNVVLLKQHNAEQLPQFLDFIRQHPVDLRFIELMETGLTRDYFDAHHLSGTRIQEHLLKEGWRLEPRSAESGPALNYSHPDYAGRIGLIMPYAKDFCADCNRLRVSSIGKLHLCLFTNAGIELRDLLGSDDQEEELLGRIHRALGHKEQGHHLLEHDTGATPHLASIGG